MSACFECEVGQCLGVNGFVQEGEAGGAEEAVALLVHFSHQHIVQPWRKVAEVKNSADV